MDFVPVISDVPSATTATAAAAKVAAKPVTPAAPQPATESTGATSVAAPGTAGVKAPVSNTPPAPATQAITIAPRQARPTQPGDVYPDHETIQAAHIEALDRAAAPEPAQQQTAIDAADLASGARGATGVPVVPRSQDIEAARSAKPEAVSQNGGQSSSQTKAPTRDLQAAEAYQSKDGLAGFNPEDIRTGSERQIGAARPEDPAIAQKNAQAADRTGTSANVSEQQHLTQEELLLEQPHYNPKGPSASQLLVSRPSSKSDTAGLYNTERAPEDVALVDETVAPQAEAAAYAQARQTAQAEALRMLSHAGIKNPEFVKHVNKDEAAMSALNRALAEDDGSSPAKTAYLKALSNAVNQDRYNSIETEIEDMAGEATIDGVPNQNNTFLSMLGEVQRLEAKGTPESKAAANEMVQNYFDYAQIAANRQEMERIWVLDEQLRAEGLKEFQAEQKAKSDENQALEKTMNAQASSAADQARQASLQNQFGIDELSNAISKAQGDGMKANSDSMNSRGLDAALEELMQREASMAQDQSARTAVDANGPTSGNADSMVSANNEKSALYAYENQMMEEARQRAHNQVTA